MISTISLETVIILVFLLIHGSILNKFLPNLTSIAEDSTPDFHYGNIDKDYYNDGDNEALDWATDLKEKSLNMKEKEEHINRTNEINNGTAKTVNNIEHDMNELNLDATISNEMNYSHGMDKAINSTIQNSFVEAVKEGVKASTNDTLNDDLKPLNGTTDKVDCVLVNGSCDNETEFNVSEAKLPHFAEKIDTLSRIVPSTTSVPANAESSSNFKNSKFLIENSPSDEENVEEATTESNIITQLAKDVDDESDNEIDNNSSEDDNKRMSKELTSDIDGEQFTSPSSSSGFITSTSSVDFSSILLNAENSVDKKTSKQKGSIAHKSGVPDFTKSNGKYWHFNYLILTIC